MSSASRSIASIALILAACSHTPTSQHDADTLVAVLPEAGGKGGTVIVHSAGGDTTVLNSAYAAADVDGAKTDSSTLDQAQIDRVFGSALAALPTAPVSYMLYFLEGSDELTAESRASLNRIAAELANRPAPEIAVIGHTDLVGSDQYND